VEDGMPAWVLPVDLRRGGHVAQRRVHLVRQGEQLTHQLDAIALPPRVLIASDLLRASAVFVELAHQIVQFFLLESGSPPARTSDTTVALSVHLVLSVVQIVCDDKHEHRYGTRSNIP